MDERTIRKTGAVVLALLAAVGGIARAQGVADPPAAADPGAYRKLDGVWQCHFLKAISEIEKKYYSVWTFEAAKRWVHIFLEPGSQRVGQRLLLGWKTACFRRPFKPFTTND